MDGTEYQDPDYPVASRSEVPHSHPERAARLERTRAIVKREIQAELVCRESEVTAIDHRMWLARRTLHRLRCTLLQQHYAAAPRHEDGREQRARGQISTLLWNKQTRLHPSQRRLTNRNIVGREEIFLQHSGQQSMKLQNHAKAENASEREKPCETIVKDEKCSTESPEVAPAKPKKIPRHIEPESSSRIVTLDQSSRSRQKHKYRIIIGNTSKYSPASSKMDRCSYKWLLYVRAPHGDISHIVREITVRLHQSYAPHHIVNVRWPPFQVCRRGWGEFPASVQLHFALPELNRPAIVEHQVKLDKRRSGLQSLGAETIVDVWLYSNQEMLKYAIKDDTTQSEPVNPQSNENKDQWSDFFSTDTTELDIDEMIIKPVKSSVNRLSEMKTDEMAKMSVNRLPEMKTDEMESSVNRLPEIKTDEMVKSSVYRLPEIKTDEMVKMSVSRLAEIKTENQNLAALECGTKRLKPEIENDELRIANIKEEPLDEIDLDSTLATEIGNVVGIKEQKTELYQYVSPVTKKLYYLELDKKTSSKFKEIAVSERLNGTSDYAHILNDHCYVPSFQMLPVKQENGKHRFDLGEVVSKMWCVRSAVRFLLSKIPIVSRSAHLFRNMFPFVVKDEESYWRLSEARRRNAEWSRAKIVNQILTKHFHDKSSIWRTKQILYFARLHGYHPARIAYEDDSSWSDHDSQYELHKNLKKLFPTASDINSGSVFDESRFSKEADFEGTSEPVELQCDSDDEVDVTGVAVEGKESMSPVKKKLEVLPIEDGEERLRCYFIEKTCSDIGIELRNEDVGNGFSHSAVHRVMLSAVRCLVAELVRTSLAETHLQEQVPRLWNINMDGSIGIQHIFSALRRHKRLRMFTMEGLHATPTEYNERL